MWHDYDAYGEHARQRHVAQRTEWFAALALRCAPLRVAYRSRGYYESFRKAEAAGEIVAVVVLSAALVVMPATLYAR